MATPVVFQLYASNGTTPVYTFPLVQPPANYPRSSMKAIKHGNLRGKGCVISNGGEEEWDLPITFILKAANYLDLMVLTDAVEAAIVLNTPYILSITKTVSTFYTFNVKRIGAIDYGDTNKDSYQICRVNFIVNSW